jgi:hypothetical protein
VTPKWSATDKRKWGAVAALFLLGEGLVVYSHPQEVKDVMRTVYQTLWHYAPKPEGYVPPERFK